MRLALHVVQGILTIALLYPLVRPATRLRLRQRWSHRLLAVLGVRVHTEGVAIAPGCMLVANHISWLDIFVINAMAPSAFISKAEVRAWPVIGWLAAKSETVFLRRGSRGHAKIVNAEIAALLDAGRNVAVFPEGTTTDGSHVLHFHAALLQPAIEAERPLQALALSYRCADGSPSRGPAYDGELSLGDSLRNILAHRELIAHIVAFAPLSTSHASHRRELAQITRDRIVERLGEAGTAQDWTWNTSPSSSLTAVSLPPQTQPESSAISPSVR
ncbi:MAG: 1-acyl-sn-glycerol-3-phosphate acyltransferase [Betaproteobacteria bacterium HGW-Betaproteobacteria-21]|nr:MAG: 1-acyl-sn-glycerol-3-phosphate acyltransferase [Betaproteobacteria bacterium HGW-Betaproteobacteria-21]